MAALVLAEHNNASLNEATAKTVTAALLISTPAHVLVAGSDCASAAEQAAKLQGVETVLVADDPRYANMLPEPVAELILSRASSYEELVLARALTPAVTPLGEKVMTVQGLAVRASR